MTLSRRPPLRRLKAALLPVLQEAFQTGESVRLISRAPLEYASSAGSDIVTCQVPGHDELRVLCKYGSAPERSSRVDHRGGTTGEARVYRTILPLLGVTHPRLYGVHRDSKSGGTWLFLEYLHPTRRIDKTPDRRLILDAAEWLGQFHARGEHGLGSDWSSGLPVYDRNYLLSWSRRTLDFARPSLRTYPWLESACLAFTEAAEVLLASPRTVLHGEFYPKNILWYQGAVMPVDWETMAIGAGEIDLAALTEGWGSAWTGRCRSRYQKARWNRAPTGFSSAFLAARYFFALRWLGHDPEWMTDAKMVRRFRNLRHIAGLWKRRNTR